MKRKHGRRIPFDDTRISIGVDVIHPSFQPDVLKIFPNVESGWSYDQ